MGTWHNTLCFAPASGGYEEAEWSCIFKEDSRGLWDDNPGWYISYTDDDTEYVLIFNPSPEEDYHFIAYYSKENLSKKQCCEMLVSLSCDPNCVEGRQRDYDVDGNEVFYVYKECFMDVLAYWPMLKEFLENPTRAPSAISWIPA